MSRGSNQVPSGRPVLRPDGRPDVSAELKNLKFEMQNTNLHRLPSNVQIQRRPLNHAPVASPHAGKNVQKVVYMSRKTPIVSAVKRVKKLLLHIEKRAMQGVDLNEKNGTTKLLAANEKMSKDGEKVYVKASGRAMEQALRVADWFRNKEEELRCVVEINTSSVPAIDDLVEINEDEEDCGDSLDNKPEDITNTTFASTEPLKSVSASSDSQSRSQPEDKIGAAGTGTVAQEKSNGRRQKKRKRPKYDRDDLPEARIRWIKTIEVAISLKT